ncbi:MAG TPA: YbjN domain-containing protein, partial [Allocoleopsis sp.]
SLELYQYIDTEALFNLEPDVRIAENNYNFQEGFPIQIEVSLKPEMLPHLQKYAASANEAVAYFLHASKLTKWNKTEVLEQESSGSFSSPNPLLATENWLALSVKQFQKSGEVGYRTYWSHASLLGLAMVDSSQVNIAEGISSFFKDLGISDLSFGSITEEIATESIGYLANLLENLNEDALEEVFQKADGDQPGENSAALRQEPLNQPILEAVIEFLHDDNWHFIPIEGQSTLCLAFEGKNGRYNCYAQAREVQQQFIFYSLCPFRISGDTLQPIAQFITRANFGMIIGNFELNFDNGEIRYKTSIDVEGDRLSSALIKQLVYTSVTMMDEYLPGIKAVLDGSLTPPEAIRSIEQASTDTTPVKVNVC